MKWTTVRIELGSRHCVSERGKADAHFRRESEEDGVASVAEDYTFIGEKVEDDRTRGKCLPILEHKDDRWEYCESMKLSTQYQKKLTNVLRHRPQHREEDGAVEGSQPLSFSQYLISRERQQMKPQEWVGRSHRGSNKGRFRVL